MFNYMRKAHYHETDQMGIIHHANYIKWMEEARLAYLEALGLGYQEVEAQQVFSPVVNVQVSYKQPVHFADEVSIKVSVKTYSGVKLELAYEFFNKTTQQVCAAGVSEHCFIKGGKIISLKRDMPALHEKILLLVPPAQ